MIDNEVKLRVTPLSHLHNIFYSLEIGNGGV